MEGTVNAKNKSGNSAVIKSTKSENNPGRNSQISRVK